MYDQKLADIVHAATEGLGTYALVRGVPEGANHLRWLWLTESEEIALPVAPIPSILLLCKELAD